jgi:hypothetical protein
MPFVHGHPRESGWVVSHYRRPQRAGDDQLDLVDGTALPAPRADLDDAADQVCETARPSDTPPDDADPDDDASVRSIPRRTASTR